MNQNHLDQNHMDQILWIKWYGPYYTVHVIWSISFGPYYMVHRKAENWINLFRRAWTVYKPWYHLKRKIIGLPTPFKFKMMVLKKILWMVFQKGKLTWEKCKTLWKYEKTLGKYSIQLRFLITVDKFYSARLIPMILSLRRLSEAGIRQKSPIIMIFMTSMMLFMLLVYTERTLLM